MRQGCTDDSGLDETQFLLAIMIFTGMGIPIILGGLIIYCWAIWMVYSFLEPLMGLNL